MKIEDFKRVEGLLEHKAKLEKALYILENCSEFPQNLFEELRDDFSTAFKLLRNDVTKQIEAV